MTSVVDIALEEVRDEVFDARRGFPKFASAHEGIAVILEEFEELKQEVWKRHPDRKILRKECRQLAAMAVCFMFELTEGEE